MQLYREALRADPANPYALAYLGHWELWNGSQGLEAAKRHFAAALAAQSRARTYVRTLQLAALQDNGNDQCDDELLRVVNDMQKHHEPVDERTRTSVFAVYYFTFSHGDDNSIRSLLMAVPPAEQLTIFRALFFNPNFDKSKIPNRQGYLAFLQEAARQDEQSGQTLLALRSSMSSEDYDLLVTRPYAAIKRLRP